MTPRQQQKLFSKLNQIFEAQEDSNGIQNQQSGNSDPEDCQIFSAINNDCLLYITKRQSNTVSPDGKLTRTPNEGENQPVIFDDLSNRLQSIQDEVPANYSRNNQKIIQQVSTDQQHQFFQQADLYNRYIMEQKVSKVPSANSTDLTFFDLSNPQHLNQLFSRLEGIQK